MIGNIKNKCMRDDNGYASQRFIFHYLAEKDFSGIYTSDNWSIVILHTGEVQFGYDNMKTCLVEGQMTIIPIKKELYVDVAAGSLITVFFFYDQLSYCNKSFVDSILKKWSCASKTIAPLKVHTYISRMLEIEQAIFQDGYCCFYLDKIFINELIALIRLYYEDEDINDFFSIMNGFNIDFKSYVLLNYENKDIMKLAEECNMSIATFNRYFRKNFGESPLQWLNKKKADLIYRELVSSEKTITEIAYDNNFSSTSYLTLFCKKYHNQTPNQIRKKFNEAVILE